MSFIFFLIIGALAGFLAGKIMRGRSFGLLANMGLGIAGAIIGGFLVRLVGFASNGLVAELLVATGGAVLLLWAVGRGR